MYDCMCMMLTGWTPAMILTITRGTVIQGTLAIGM